MFLYKGFKVLGRASVVL